MSTSPKISETAVIGGTSRVGVRYRQLLEGEPMARPPTEVGEQVWIGEFCVVGEGVILSDGVIVDHYSQIESGVRVGDNTLITYKAQICADAVIGSNCVIGGFIAERTRVGHRCRVFGSVVHHHISADAPWDSEQSIEAGVTVFDDVFIGFNSVVARDVKIGPKSYVCAGSLVTRDVPEFHIAFGVNKLVHYTQWPGNLRTSSFFSQGK